MKFAGTCLAAAALGLAVAGQLAHAEESFDASAFEKKAFEWTGFVELRPERQLLRRDAAGYQLQFPGDSRTSLERRSVAAEVSGVARHNAFSFSFTGHASAQDDARGSDGDSRMYEAYAGWQPDPSRVAEIGKRALRWGKGYAWSAVAFLERPKDPSDPELAREGFVMATGAWVRTFDGPLQTLTLTGALVPTTSQINSDFGAAGHLNPAIKLYGLLYDTDVDLIYAARGSRGPRLGVDFSRNLGSNLEVHGEWARITDAPRATLNPANLLVVQQRSSNSYLLGLRYLTERDTTIVGEYFRNGSGYSAQEASQYFDLVHASTTNPALVLPATRAAAQGYNRPNAMRSYAYLRVSQKEPFDVLDFTPSVTLIANTADRSFSLIPEALYTGFKNLELRLRLALNRGQRSSDYGEKAVQSKLELRARYFF